MPHVSQRYLLVLRRESDLREGNRRASISVAVAARRHRSWARWECHSSSSGDEAGAPDKHVPLEAFAQHESAHAIATEARDTVTQRAQRSRYHTKCRQKAPPLFSFRSYRIRRPQSEEYGSRMLNVAHCIDRRFKMTAAGNGGVERSNEFIRVRMATKAIAMKFASNLLNGWSLH